MANRFPFDLGLGIQPPRVPSIGPPAAFGVQPLVPPGLAGLSNVGLGVQSPGAAPPPPLPPLQGLSAVGLGGAPPSAPAPLPPPAAVGLPPMPTRGKKESPAAFAQRSVAAAGALKEQGIVEGGEAQVAKEQAVAAKKAQAYQADLAAIEAQAQQRAERERIAAEKSEQLAAEATANARETPDKGAVWGTGAVGVLKRLGGILGVVSGAVYRVRQGGPNVALQMINKTIDDSIRQQTEAINRRGANIKEQQTLLAQWVARGESLDNAQSAARIAMREDAAGLAESEGAKYEPGIRQAKNKELAGALRADNVKEQETMRGNEYNRQIAGANLALAKKGQAFSQAMAERNYDLEVRKLDQAGRAAEAAAMEKAKEQTVFGLTDPKTGKPMVVQDSKRAAQANSLIAEANKTVNDIERFRELHAALPEVLTRTGAASALSLGRPEMLQEPYKSQLIEYRQLRGKLETAQFGGGKIQQPDGTVVNVPVINFKVNLDALGSADPSVVDKQKQLIRDSIRGDVTTSLKNEVGYQGQPITFDAEMDAATRANAERLLSGEGEIQSRNAPLGPAPVPLTPPSVSPAQAMGLVAPSVPGQPLDPFLQTMLRGRR